MAFGMLLNRLSPIRPWLLPIFVFGNQYITGMWHYQSIYNLGDPPAAFYLASDAIFITYSLYNTQFNITDQFHNIITDLSQNLKYELNAYFSV